MLSLRSPPPTAEVPRAVALPHLGPPCVDPASYSRTLLMLPYSRVVASWVRLTLFALATCLCGPPYLVGSRALFAIIISMVVSVIVGQAASGDFASSIRGMFAPPHRLFYLAYSVSTVPWLRLSTRAGVLSCHKRNWFLI